MDTRIEAELAEQLDKLGARYKQLAEWLGQTIRDMESAGRPPSVEILHDLGHSRTKFIEIRDRVHLEAAAEGISPLPEPEHLIALEDLRQLLARVEDSRTRMLKRKEICKRAQEALDRVLALRHREEPDFAPLADCLAKAKELRQRAAEIEFSGEADPPADVLEEVQAVADGHHPLCDLLAQVEAHDSLDDDRWHDLTAHITRAFGKPLATAAARGKLQGMPARPTAPAAPSVVAPPEPAKVAD